MSTINKQVATLTNVAASATVVTLFAVKNGSGTSRAVFNDATTAMYIAYGAAASLTNFTVKVAIGGYYEFPRPLYTGLVTAIWDAGPTGSARTTEI